MQKFKQLYISLLILLPLTAGAQLTVQPIEKKPTPERRSSARIQADTVPASIPFWDDFSFVTSDHAVDTLWLDNSMVLVNNGQAVNPPSLNVATFDGLNEFGVPYSASPTDILDFGYRDTLMSQPIKMAEINASFRDSVFLSFHFQGGGHGEPPDTQDFLRLEFKDENDIWEEVMVLTSEEVEDPTAFYDTIIQINDNKYYYDRFQFRFISFGRKSGRYDAWHLDYVYLNKRRFLTDNSYADRALSARPGALFGNYYAVPLKHFFPQPEINTTSFFASNLFKIATVLTYYTEWTTIKNYTSSSTSSTVLLDIDEPVGDDAGTTDPHEVKEGFLTTLPNPVFDAAAKGYEFTLKLRLSSGDNNAPSGPLDYSPNYIPIDFRWNDTTEVHYALDSVYAYDDGEAEYAAGLIEGGNVLAYRFDDVHAGADSIVNAVYIHFPYFAGANFVSTQLFIFDNNNGEPGGVLYQQSIDIAPTTDNQFTYIELIQDNERQGVVVKGTFFIGYREPSASSVRVGLDKSNNTADKMYFKITDTSPWQLNDRVTGSLMIRPQFGYSDIVVGLPETQPKKVSLYPNPSAGVFNLKGSVDQLQVYTITGQPVLFTTEDFGEEKRISVTAASPGVYIIRYRSGSKIFTDKIVITR